MLSLQRTEAVRLEESLCERLELPRDFTLEAPPAETKMPKMYALRAAAEGGGPEGGRMMVEGVVSRRTSLLPTASLDYRVFAKKRQIQHHRKERRVELLRDDWGPGGEGGRGAGGAVRKMIDLNAPLSGAGVGRGTGGRDGPQRVRLDQAGLRTALFKCFQLKSAWTARELVARLGQPEGSVKSALREISDYQTQGDYFGKYLLKTEFRGKDGWSKKSFK